LGEELENTEFEELSLDEKIKLLKEKEERLQELLKEVDIGI
jgi:cell fate (sporulation/competence/biofilm development) regulator YlbF (YheA/YmcA/DUF963 family)